MQLELMDYQIENEKWHEILNPLIQKSNQENIKTNKNTRISNYTLMFIFAITAFFAYKSSNIATLTYDLEVKRNTESKSEFQLNQLQLQIQLLQKQLQIQGEKILHPNKMIDTLGKKTGK